MTARTRSSSASAVAKNRPPSSRSDGDARERLVARDSRRARGRPACPARGRAAASAARSRRRRASRARATTPMTTPASTPAESTPTIAATAIQKSNRVTRCRRRSSRDVDHPEDDRVDDHRGEHRPSAGPRRAARARSASAARAPPVTSDATGVRAPADSFSELADRLVETGIPWNTPAPTFAMPCATDSWFDVDAVAVPRRERARVAGGLREADQQQRDRGDADRRQVVADEIASPAAPAPAGRAGTWPTSATPCAPRSKSRRCEQPADDEHERARDRGRGEAQPEDHAERRRAPTSSVVQWIVAERPDPRRQLAPRVVAARRRARSASAARRSPRRPRRRRGSR